MSRHDRIVARLTESFTPQRLLVEDDSARHAGHAGARALAKARPGAAASVGETHFNVTLVSAQFAGMNRVARSRAVHQALAAELEGGLHALALVLRTPEEDAAVGTVAA